MIFVINALLTSWISDALKVSFGTALLGALIITVVSWLLNVILPDDLET